MAFPKGCANLDKLYSGFSSSSSPLPSLLHLLLLCCSSSRPVALLSRRKRVESRSKVFGKVAEGNAVSSEMWFGWFRVRTPGSGPPPSFPPCLALSACLSL